MIFVTYNMLDGLLSAATDPSSSVAGVNFGRMSVDGQPYRLSVAPATEALAAILEKAENDLSASVMNGDVTGRLSADDAWEKALAAIEIGELMDGSVGTPEEARASVVDSGAFRGTYIGEIDALAGHSADVIVTAEGTEARFVGTGTAYDAGWSDFPDSAFIPEDRIIVPVVDGARPEA